MRLVPPALVFAATALLRASAQAGPSPAELEFFETRVRPVLVEHCYKCHSAEAGKRKGGLQLDTRDGLRGGGDSGPALVAGEPEKSLIIKAVRRSADLEMPPDEKLPASAVADLAAWVKMGAPDPREPRPAAGGKIQVDAARAATHWAYQPPKDPPLPPCARLGWCRTGVDNFVIAKLAEQGIEPAPAADRRTLIRRATFDLWGVPPTPQEIDAFVADRSPRPFEKLVDRLLASPRYGERWGRFWLDVARYSDTKGYVFREERRYPFAWTYRDWVIRSLNEDMPYDRFLVYQLAADRLVKGDDRAPLAAMGFLTLGRRFLNRVPDIIDDRIDVVARGTMAMTVGCARCHDHKFDPISTKDYYALYGVFASSEEPKELPVIATKKTRETLAYEKEIAEKKAAADDFRRKKHDELLAALRAPKAIADYLVAAHEAGASRDPEMARTLAQKRDLRPFLLERWGAFIKKSGEAGHPLHDALAPVRDPAAALAAVREAAEAAAPQLAGAEPLQVGLPDTEKLCNRADREKLQDLERKIEEVRATHPGAPAGAHVLVDVAKPITPRVFIRGNPENPGEEVPRRFLTVLSRPAPQPFRDGSGRLELARAIASADNPLTARVMVNRVWLQHFGAGIVRTPSDFGLRSEPPTHPELLDWLAHRFVDGGWSLKKLQRMIMLSATYQQASEPAPSARAKDPDNALLSRMNRRRLDFEAMRDSLLAAAGRLDTTVGGRPVPFVSNASAKTRQEAETVRNEAAGDPTQDVYARRRSVYLFVDRQSLPGVFRDFDFASPDAHSPQRFSTSVPQQALFLMNSPFVVEQARAVVARPEVAREKDPERRVQALYRVAFGRRAGADEVATARRFVDAASAPRPEPLVDGGIRPQVWLYGYGRYDGEARKVTSFAPLPHFSGQAWQGGPQLPDKTLGFTMLSAGGGHPGRDADHAAIRRWVAPRAGEVTIAGTLSHASDRGDGIEARIVSSRTGEIASFVAHNTEAETRIARLEVKQGETLDFVVGSRGNDGFDGFTWAPMISMKTVSAAAGGEMTVEWSASGEFAGPSKARALGAWQKLAQVLLVSNEFMFVD